MKSRALEHDAHGEMTGLMEAYAKGGRGHVDCREIIKDRAIGRAIPIVQVTHPEVKVTPEAAIGTVGIKKWETRPGTGHKTDCQRRAAIGLSPQPAHRESSADQDLPGSAPGTFLPVTHCSPCRKEPIHLFMAFDGGMGDCTP